MIGSKTQRPVPSNEVVVGGSTAGLRAALVLGLATIAVLDADAPR